MPLGEGKRFHVIGNVLFLFHPRSGDVRVHQLLSLGPPLVSGISLVGVETTELVARVCQPSKKTARILSGSSLLSAERPNFRLNAKSAPQYRYGSGPS